MGTAKRQGVGLSVQDGMIAAIVRINDGRLATRNLKDFQIAQIDTISPWEA